MIADDDSRRSPLVRIRRLKLRDGLGRLRRSTRGPRGNGLALFLELTNEALPTFFGEEIARVHLRQANTRRKLVGAGADQHHVRALLHDGLRERDGVLRTRNSGDRARHHRLAIHDGGVEFVLAVGREDGTFPGVEERIVLELLQCGFDCVDCRAVGIEHLCRGAHSFIQACAIRFIALRRHRAALNHACSAVQHDSPLARGRLGDERSVSARLCCSCKSH